MSTIGGHAPRNATLDSMSVLERTGHALGEQQAVLPQLLEPLCRILVEGGERCARQAGTLKSNDSIYKITALVE